ncbi:MAG: VOC family protein [Verrucomicrobiales bacterium]
MVQKSMLPEQSGKKRAILSLVVIRAANIDHLGSFYTALGLNFNKHRHGGSGPDHLSCELGGTVFEIYPIAKSGETTLHARLGFSVASLSASIEQLQAMGATVLTQPSDTEFGRRAVVKDFEGHKVELYERP